VLSAAATAPAPFVPPPGNPRFPLVDGVRALAALSILLGHTAAESGFTADHALGVLTARLDLGVAIFFVLSGFLLYRPFAAARWEGRPPVRVRDYVRRRVLRIVPAYWVALAVLAVLVGLPSFWDGPWWRSFAFAQIYWSDSVLQGIAPAWTLCVEISFYLVLPFLAAAIGGLSAGGSRARRAAVELGALAGLAAGSLAVRAALGPEGRGVLDSTLVCFLDWFACGMALAVLSVLPRGALRRPAAVRAVDRWPSAPWLVAGAVFWLVATQAGLPRGFAETERLGSALGGHLLYAVVAVLVVLPAIVGDPGRGAVRRLLGHPVAAWLGLVSYALFLYHQPLAGALHEAGADGWLPGSGLVSLTVLTLAVSVPCAAASYYLVERPFLRRKDSGSSAASRRAAASASAPDAVAATARQASGLPGSAAAAARASRSA